MMRVLLDARFVYGLIALNKEAKAHGTVWTCRGAICWEWAWAWQRLEWKTVSIGSNAVQAPGTAKRVICVTGQGRPATVTIVETKENPIPRFLHLNYAPHRRRPTAP
jgi:hypothetical protein